MIISLARFLYPCLEIRHRSVIRTRSYHMGSSWNASRESGVLLHLLPTFGAEFGPGGDWFSTVGQGCHGLGRGRDEHGCSTIRAEPRALLNAVSALGAGDERRLRLH